MADLQQETIDYVAICRLQAAYADSVTRRAWSELGDLFEPSARELLLNQKPVLSPAMATTDT